MEKPACLVEITQPFRRFLALPWFQGRTIFKTGFSAKWFNRIQGSLFDFSKQKN